MVRSVRIFAITLFFIVNLSLCVFSEETLNITTYYPSPYGSYNQLTTTGNTYLATTTGNVGIGTTNPGTKLEVAGTVKISSGSIYTTNWTGVTFGSGWSNYGSGYQAVQYKKVGDLVFLRGLANSGSNAWATYPTITTLPAGNRPAARLIFNQMANANQAVRLDIDTSGNVLYVAGGAGSNWLSLDGIVFSVD